MSSKKSKYICVYQHILTIVHEDISHQQADKQSLKNKIDGQQATWIDLWWQDYVSWEYEINVIAFS